MTLGSDGSTPMMEGGRLLADRYRLLEKVGEGGAAEVFRARDQRLDRIVAIKLLRSQYSYDEPSRKRFVVEAKTAAGLSHPNIVDIYDFGEAQDGSMFIAMQFISGRNLKDLLQRRGRLTPGEAVSITRQACQALAVAHERGLVHRDVKPQNFLIDKAGRVRLTDFGIVKALSGPALTQSGMTFGTAAYMSPEQATGSSVTAASDLYSLGCVMYEMLSGIPPFTGENPAIVAYKQVWEQPRPLHELVPEAPPSLEAVVMRLLNKDPKRRYSSTESLLKELDALNVAANQPTSAMPVESGAYLAEQVGATDLPTAPRVPHAAEVSQAVAMPVSPNSPNGGQVPPARVGVAGPITPPPMQAVPPAYTAAPYTGQAAGEVRVNVSRRRRLGWIPAALALLLGLGLCGVGAWQGSSLLGAMREASTPTVSATLVVAQPPATLMPATATVSVALAPATLVPTRIEATATPQPLAPTETPAPTEEPPTDTPQPPTDTPQPADTPTLEPVVVPPTEEPPTVTPFPIEPTATSAPIVGSDNGVTLEDSAFSGGYRRLDGLYHGRTATWVYGQGTQYRTMSASFDIANPPTGNATLQITGLDSEDAAKTPIFITLNGIFIYNGANPLPNDFPNGVFQPGNWGSYNWAIPPGTLVQGTNTLSISNLDPSDKINQPPFFLLDYAVISW